MSKYLAISNESAWEKLSKWDANSSNLMLRFSLAEGAGYILPVKLRHLYLGDRVVLRPGSGGASFMFLLSGASFETEPDSWAVDSLVIRYLRGGHYCMLSELREPDQWPEFVFDDPTDIAVSE